MGECVISIIAEVTLKVISYSFHAPKSRCACVTVAGAADGSREPHSVGRAAPGGLRLFVKPTHCVLGGGFGGN